MRITLAQLNYTIGDFKGNYQLIANTIEKFASSTDLIVFSELCMSGYYPKDLIYHEGFIETQNEYLDKLVVLTRKLNTAVVIGYIDSHKMKKGKYHNSLCLISNGTIEYVYHKRLLPVYNIFDEARHFRPGKEKGYFRFKNCNLGFLICEDGWVGLNEYRYECDPVDDLEKSDVDAIICINGSPSNIGKQKDRLNLFSNIAKRCQCPLLFTNQVGGHDDIVFDGASFVVDSTGEHIASLKYFESDAAQITIENKTVTKSSHQPMSVISNVELFYRQTILGLQDYLRKTGYSKVVLGLSGGIDSALTLALSVMAIGADKVSAIAMPSQFSSPSSITDAQTLCDNYGIPLFKSPIDEQFHLALKNFEAAFNVTPNAITTQNIQARIRGRILMEFSNQFGALVLSTGNKSELSVGYTTLYGDMTGGYNLIGDLYKTDVYDLANYINKLHPSKPIPQSIIDKAPSAELAPNQKDTDSLPPYDLLDPILKLYIEGDLLPQNELDIYHTISKQDQSTVEQIRKMVDKSEFKRRQAAPIVRVQRRAFGHG